MEALNNQSYFYARMLGMMMMMIKLVVELLRTVSNRHKFHSELLVIGKSFIEATIEMLPCVVNSFRAIVTSGNQEPWKYSLGGLVNN